ncbi:PrsW family intramembrane metalloprotease [Paenibacillus tyrfis]|nr:PrsW family intramembrane metalloprotease [Paenibacillus tyrfis]
MLWLRGLLSPFGHGTWTAVMAAGWWRWNRRSAERGCYAACMAATLYAAAAIGLHFLWDAVAGTGSLGLLLQLVIGACGLWLLRRLIRQGTGEEIRALLRVNPDLAQAAASAESDALAELRCAGCGTVSPRGAGYCARCGQALRAGDNKG